MFRLQAIFALAAVSACALASDFTPGNVLVTEKETFAGATYLKEYSRTGALVQSLEIPQLPGQDGFDAVRGLSFDSAGRLLIYNGSTTVGISRYDASADSWTHFDVPGVKINNGTAGKIATFGDFVFLPTHDSALPGIVRLNTADGTTTSFYPGDQNQNWDLNIGSDGTLYALNGAGSPSGLSIDGFNPVTLERTKSIGLYDLAYVGNADIRDVIPLPNGNFLAGDLYRKTYLLDPNGSVLQTYLDALHGQAHDLNRASDGTLMQVYSGGNLNLYDSSFGLLTTIGSGTDSGYGSFGAFVPQAVPEPATMIALGAGVLALMRRRKNLSPR